MRAKGRQGRFDKATFELHELGGDRIVEHDERLSELLAEKRDLPLLGSMVSEGSSAEFVVVFANIKSPSNQLVFRVDSNELYSGSISFDLSRFLSESLTPTPVPTQTPIPTPSPTPAPIQISLAELLDEYDQNKVRANTRLRYLQNGKRLVSTSGYIDEVEELYSTITPIQDTFSPQDLRCYYADTRTALHITKGQLVSVTGRVIGLAEFSSDVQMYACEFDGIDFETKPIAPVAALRMNVVGSDLLSRNLRFGSCLGLPRYHRNRSNVNS